MSGQTISDRLLAARHSIAGQGLAKSVCKATTEEVIGPKKKHLDYLLHCTNEPNVSIPQLANLLIERSQNSNWVVVFKSLVTTHHLMCYGNERFTQYLASSNCSFQLGNFLDKGNVAGYDMSPYIRRYAKYLNEKALAYRTVAFDFCKVKRGKEDGVLRTMPADKLLKTIPVLQSQIDALLEFDCSANDLTNGVVNTAFLLLFRDLIRLFACYNDGIINLLEKYFDMNKKQCKDALDFYKKFLVRMDRVAEFLKVAENVGIDKGDIPDLTKAPSSLLEALESHLATLEGKKPATSSSSNISLAQHNGAMAANAEQIDESLKRQALAEEEAAMTQYKKSTNPFLSSPTAASAAPLPSTAGVPTQQPILDLFGEELDSSGAATASFNSQTSAQRASDDLLQLAANPFASPTGSTPAVPPLPSNNAWSGATSQNGFSSQFATENSFASAFGNTSNKSTNAADAGTVNPFGAPLQSHASPAHPGPPRPPPPGSNTHTHDLLAGLDSGATQMGPSPSPAHQPSLSTSTIPSQVATKTNDNFGNFDFLPNASPAASSAPPNSGENAAMYASPSKQAAKGFDAFGDLLQPGANAASMSAAAPQPTTSTQKVLTGDLESSLASLAQNLTINKSSQAPKTPQWSGAGKSGGAVQQPQPAGQWNVQPMMGVSMTSMPMSAGAGGIQGQMAFRPMQPMAPMSANSMAPMGGMTAPFVASQPMNPMMASGIRPTMTSTGAPMGAFPMGGMNQPMTGVMPAMRAATNQQLDPFGAL